MNNYSIIMLGPSGSGKTVFLASMYKKLSTQSNLGFFLQVDTGEKRKRLNNIYTQVAVDDRWPAGTRANEVSEWVFTCCVQRPDNLSIYNACSFTYLDYAGGRLTEEADDEDPEFESKLNNCDALLGLLDGQKLCSLIRGEKAGKIWAIRDLGNMLNVMQRSDKPVQFVVSKWDIVQKHHSLEQIRDSLLQDEGFQNLVRTRNKQKTPVRLIPVSAVGAGFAIPKADGGMEKTGKLPNPYQVEAPLACILPDMIQTMVEELIRKRESELQRAIEVKPDIGFLDFLGQLFAGGLKVVQELLPRKYQFADDVLKNLIVWAETPAKQKTEFAARRTEELRQEQAKSLQKVADEETALTHSVNCFLSIQNQLAYHFPASELNI